MLATTYALDPNGYALPPQCVEAEESILGGCILDPEAYHRIKDLIVSPDVFYISIHQIIWEAIDTLGKEGKPTDLMLVTQQLEDAGKLDDIGGTLKLCQLVERTVSAVNIDVYTDLLLEKYNKRQLILFAHKCQELAYDTTIRLEKIPSLYAHLGTELNKLSDFSFSKDSRKFERKQFQRKIEKIREILLKEEDPAFRDELLHNLAKSYNCSKQRLEDLYYKSLIGDHNEQFLTIDELQARYGSNVRDWTLHGWFPKGIVTILFAQGGLGKTRLAYDFIYHLATGTNWNEFPILGKKKIALIQTDEQPSDMLENLRTRGINDGHDIIYKTKWTVSHIHNLYKEVEEHRPQFLVIDSLTSASKFETVSENAIEYARPILALNDIAKEFGCHILLLHHANKEHDVRGSSAIRAAVSQVIQLSRDPASEAPDSTLRIATFVKSRARRPASYRLNFEPETGEWTCLSQVGAGNKDIEDINAPLKDQIVRLLQNNPNQSYTCKDIQVALKANLNSIRGACNALKTDGVIIPITLEMKGKPKAYYLPSDSDRDISSIKNDRNRDRKAEPAPDEESSQNSPLTDRTIAKNGGLENFSQTDFSDQTIAKTPGEGSIPDPSADPVPDRDCDRHCDRDDIPPQPTEEDERESHIQDALSILNIGHSPEIYASLTEAYPPDILEAAIARLSPEQQATIKNLDTGTDAGSDNVQNHPPVEPQEDQKEQAIQALVRKIEACRKIEHWRTLQEKEDPELLAIAFGQASLERQEAINRQVVLEQQEEDRRRQRERNYVNPFKESDTVAMLGSVASGLGTIVETHKDQCKVQWTAGYEGIEKDSRLIKVGQTILYCGQDENLKLMFISPKASPEKYRSRTLIVKSMKADGESVAIEVTTEDWTASFWVDLRDLKR